MPREHETANICPCKQWRRAREMSVSVGQSLEELIRFYDELPEKVQRVLEIGTKEGGWLLMLASVLPAPAHLCAVDSVYSSKFDISRQELRRLGHDVCLITKPSDQALSDVKKWLGADRLDVLHLDGVHVWPGVFKDWQTYSPWVRPGGIVAIHDVEPTAPAAFGAQRLFRMLEKTYTTRLCERTWRGGLGIGVVHIE